jgi:asparagine synthase (glutamine-hydrolysing)
MSIYGSISTSAADAPFAQPAGSTGFPGGYLLLDDDRVDVARTADGFCLAWGRPTFDDAALAAVGCSEGTARAWQQAFERFGDGAARHARGRFAVAWLQPTERRLRLVTDRFGTWPLCFSHAAGGALHFADRADTVPLPRREIDVQALFDYLYHHCIPAPRTAFAGVQRLRAGHVASWHDGVLEVRRYWQPQFDASAGGDLEAAKRRFLDIVTRSVAHDAEGADTGAFLSGGTDSSTVSGLLGPALGRAADTYSIGFDAAGYDEMRYARIAAKHFGTRHHEYYVTPADLLEGIPLVAAFYDQPFGNSSAVPAWVCARRARDDGRARLLAGDGGDELFGGNARYAKQQVFERYGRVPPWLRTGFMEPVLGSAAARRLPGFKKAASYIEQARVPLPGRTQMYNLLWRLGPREVLSGSFLRRVDLALPDREQDAVWREADADSVLDRQLAFDWKYTLADNDLPKVVGTAQLAGVDVAFPLLSDELLDFSLTLPDHWKLRGQELRWFFKEALRGTLPPEIIAKKKHGFGLPFGVWSCTHAGLQALAADALGSVAQRSVVRPQFVQTLLQTHLPAHPGYYGEMVWILMTLEFWLRRHAPSWALRD